MLARFDKVVVKSQFHARHLGLDPALCVVIPNGVRLDLFRCEGVEREPLRFVYASDYSRGLEPILRWQWPRLRHLLPQATLHVSYGMSLHPPAFQARMRHLLSQPGVEVGR